MKATSSCLSLFLAVGLPSQTVHLVGPGGFPQIAAALAVAAPGDILHVQPGNYAGFTASVGVTIRKLDPSGGGQVNVGSSLVGGGALSLAPPQGQELHLADLEFANGVRVLGGRVTFDGCRIQGATNFPGDAALTVLDATVHLQSTTCGNGLNTTGHSLRAQNADITAARCRFDSGIVNANVPPVVALQNCRLHASDCVFQALIFGPFPYAGIRAQASTVWLSDSQVATNSPGGCAIENVGSTVRLSRNQSNSGFACAMAAPGSELLGVERPARLQPGTSFGLEFHTEPTGFVIVFAGPQLSTVDWQPFLEQPSWLLEAPSFAAALLLADANGDAAISWPIPGGPGIADQRLWFKGIGGLSLPLQSSPVVGGVVR